MAPLYSTDEQIYNGNAIHVGDDVSHLPQGVQDLMVAHGDATADPLAVPAVVEPALELETEPEEVEVPVVEESPVVQVPPEQSPAPPVGAVPETRGPAPDGVPAGG